MSYKRGALAAVGCIVLQIPYGVSCDSEEAGAVGTVLSRVIPSDESVTFDGYSDHWWWDNAAHVLGGYAVGTVLSRVCSDERRAMQAFFAVTGVWEAFEYHTDERPWHTDENDDMVWTFDHAMEDTALDTVAGAAGAWLAIRS